MDRVVFQSVHKKFRRGRFFVSRGRRTEAHALKGVSLKVSDGEVLGILGPNGSGKSTTLKLISTILLPDSGEVLVCGCDTRASGQAVREQVGLALPSERSFFPRLTVRENLDFFAALEDVPRREVRDRVSSALHDVSLTDAADKQVMKLSSGMYQRLGIARALLKKPSVLLLDEPTRSLDAAAARQLWKLLRELAGSGMTIVMATHNFEEVVAVCDRAAILQKGELLTVSTVSYFNCEALRDFYFQKTEEADLLDDLVMEVPA